MKRLFDKLFCVAVLLGSIHNVHAQSVGINTPTPNASAALDVVSANQGVLVPRLTLSATNVAAPVALPATSLLVYNTATAGVGATAVTPGYYYWDGVQWVRFETGGTHNTLDMAYDEGGAGAGRIIAADAGTVEINGTGGLSVATSTSTLSQSVLATNTNGTYSTTSRLGYVGTNAGNVVVQGVTGLAEGTQATAQWDGIYGVIGTAKHPSDGTINLNATIGSANKYVGVYGGLSSRTSVTGSAQDMLAAVLGVTGLHNSSGGTVTGSKLYAGLFAGNGRTLGLWGENSTYMEFLPRWQQQDYDAAIVGFYNTDVDGGNNDSDIGTGDTYFSIEANVTDATAKNLVMQARTTGNVGIGVATPTEKLHVTNNVRIEGLSGVGNRLVQSNATGVLSNIADGTAGQVLTTNGAGVLSWGNAATTAWDLLGNAGTNPTTNFLGTTDAQDLVFRTNNVENVRVNIDGNVGIGTTSNAARLYVNLPNTDATTNYGIYNDYNGADAGTTYAIYNRNDGSTNSTKYGIYNNVDATGTGTHYGIYNLTYMNTASNATGYGTYNYLSSYGSGNHRAVYNYLNVGGTTASNNNFAAYNYLNVSSSTYTGDVYGEYTNVDYSSGARYGEYKNMNSNATYDGDVYGDYNRLYGAGDGVNYAVYNSMEATGTGIKYAVDNEFAAINGTKYGVYNQLADGAASGNFYGAYTRAQNQTTYATRYGMYNYIRNNTGAAYGAANNLDYNTGTVYGSWNDMDQNESTVYGTYNYISQPSTSGSTLYGEYTYMSSTGTGTHYGLYMNVSGDANDYAALFYAGNVVANEIGGNYDFRIEGDTETDLFHVDASTDNVGIGMAAPFYKLDIYDPDGTDPTYVYRGRNSSATGTRTQIGSVEYFQDQSSTIDFTGGSRFSINLNAAAAYNLQVATNSAAKPGSNVWTVASDERLKQDINPFKDGLATLRGIKPVYFQYNGKANIKDNHYFVGVVAQELENVAPYMVGSFESAPGDIPFEEQEAAKETYKSVDNGAMTYVAINAIKELDEQQTKMKTVVRNISDFGVETANASQVFVPFSEDFKNMLTATPVVTVTPIGSNANLSIVSQTTTGFTVETNGASNVNFNWIAMAKVKEGAFESNTDYTDAERKAMLAKVKAEEAKIDFQREYDEAAQRKIEQAKEAAEKAKRPTNEVEEPKK